MLAEVIKVAFAALMIRGTLQTGSTLGQRLRYVTMRSKKMMFLALIYGLMNILSFVALRNIGAGMFTVFAQCKIMSTATFSAVILGRSYSWTRWRALVTLMLGVLLFSEPVWNDSSSGAEEGARHMLGTAAVLAEVSLSGFASIYFEKVVKDDPDKMNIWERNFQLALYSFPMYIGFILHEGGGHAGFFGGWSQVTYLLSALGAAGGLLVALSIKHGDSILKTLATTGGIVLSSVLDRLFLSGPLTPVMVIAGMLVIVSICNYTFDATQVVSDTLEDQGKQKIENEKEMNPLLKQEEGFACDDS